MYEKPTIKSKTVVAIITNIILAIFIILSGRVKETEITIDNMVYPPSHSKEDVVGIGLLGASAVALKGRFDVDKRLRNKK